MLTAAGSTRLFGENVRSLLSASNQYQAPYLWALLVLIMAKSTLQIRVTAAEPGRVDFELDIQKEHTVSRAPIPMFSQCH